MGQPSSTPSPASATQETPPTKTATGETQRYAFGEWHATEQWNGQWQFTVVSLSLSTTYDTDDNETYQMPSDRQLLVSKAKVRNPSSKDQRFNGTPKDPTMFAAIAGEESYSERYRIDNSEADRGNIEVTRLKQVTYKEIRRYTTHGQGVKSEETIDIAIVCTIPRGLSRGDLEIGYAENGNAQYPIRWVPE